MKTTTKFAMTLLGLMLCSTIYAQNLYLKGGANLSSMYGMDFQEEEGLSQKWKPGFHFGLGMDYNFNNKWSLQSGVEVTGRGTTFESILSEEIDGVMETFSMRFGLSMYYLNLPLAVRYRIPLNDNTGIFIETGVYFGVGLTGKTSMEFEYQGETVSEEEPLDWTWMQSRTDIGFSIGAGVEVKKFQLGFYGDYGLKPVFEDGTGHQNLRLSLGYKIFSAR